MNKFLYSFPLLLFLMPVLFLVAPPSALCDPMIPVGTTLSEFKLQAPASPEDCAYLGIKKGENFNLSDLSSKLFVIEFYSTYCAKCHGQAETAEKLFKLIQSDPALKNDVKIFAVALASRPDAVADFSKKYNLTFPQLIDEEGKIQLALKIKVIPQTLVVTKGGKVLANHDSIDQDLDEILKEIRSGLNQE